MAKPKRTAKSAPKDTTYYASYVAQRLSLLMAVASAFILWASLIAIAHGFSFANSIDGVQFVDLDDLNSGTTTEIGRLANSATFFSLLAVAVNLLIMGIPRFRVFDKKLIADGLLISGFCLVTSMGAQSIYAAILSWVVG